MLVIALGLFGDVHVIKNNQCFLPLSHLFSPIQTSFNECISSAIRAVAHPEEQFTKEGQHPWLVLFPSLSGWGVETHRLPNSLLGRLTFLALGLPL